MGFKVSCLHLHSQSCGCFWFILHTWSKFIFGFAEWFWGILLEITSNDQLCSSIKKSLAGAEADMISSWFFQTQLFTIFFSCITHSYFFAIQNRIVTVFLQQMRWDGFNTDMCKNSGVTQAKLLAKPNLSFLLNSCSQNLSSRGQVFITCPLRGGDFICIP